jgi:hypothetical protein
MADPNLAYSDYVVLSVQPVGSRPTVNIAVLLLDARRDEIHGRFRNDLLNEVDPESIEVMSGMQDHLIKLAGEMGGSAVLLWMEDTLSNYVRISERFQIPTPVDWRACVEDLFSKLVAEESANA